MHSRSQTIESPALVLGRMEVVEKPRKRRRRFSGTAFKQAATRHLWWALHRVPEPILRGYLRWLVAAAQLLARIPGNPLLESCTCVSRLAARRGVRHEPAGICREFLDGIRTVLEHGLTLFRHGASAVMGTIRIEPPGLLQQVREAHGGAILCVPHNPGAVFASTRVCRTVPTVLIMRNSSSIDRTRISVEAFERMGARAFMARDASPFGMTRAFLRVLRDKNILVATVDRIERGPTRTRRRFLGTSIGFGAWAARIAVHSQTPIVPAYVTAARSGVVVHLGQPVVPTSLDEAMDAYLRYFEDWIVREPAAWSFLADRRWRWVLGDAARGRTDSDGGRVDPKRARTRAR